MKNFEWCKLDLITFEEKDVIATSGAFTSNAVYGEDATFGSIENLFWGGNN